MMIKALKLLESITRWMGVRAVSFGIGSMKNVARRLQLRVKKTG
jgi:hypothetical protein